MTMGPGLPQGAEVQQVSPTPLWTQLLDAGTTEKALQVPTRVLTLTLMDRPVSSHHFHQNTHQEHIHRGHRSHPSPLMWGVAALSEVPPCDTPNASGEACPCGGPRRPLCLMPTNRP